ncbi:MAG: prolyl oligopeptidase family serine peptidase [Microscillaceae bacterium]|nr:prolyl oligopeptidase family serine peptidase [Microscillaceae bacterium]MDW8460599.1 prolyl oligopeptidase family serine peptidase [Cytophagales bacterium]
MKKSIFVKVLELSMLMACSYSPPSHQSKPKKIISNTMEYKSLYRKIPIKDSTDYLNRFEPYSFKQLPYQLQKPLDYDSTQSYPLLLFLHGVLHRGTDNQIQTEDILPIWASRKMQKKYPCFLVAPQCPKTTHWARFRRENGTVVMESEPSEPVRLLFELIDTLCQEFPIDRKRIYITGLSMGGFGTFDMLLRKPNLFAAAVPVCGGGVDSRADEIKHIPMWIFHGSQDEVVSVKYSRDMVKNLEKLGASPRYTEYADVKHDSWVEAYQDMAMWEWLFAQKRQ